MLQHHLDPFKFSLGWSWTLKGSVIKWWGWRGEGIDVDKYWRQKRTIRKPKQVSRLKNSHPVKLLHLRLWNLAKGSLSYKNELTNVRLVIYSSQQCKIGRVQCRNYKLNQRVIDGPKNTEGKNEGRNTTWMLQPHTIQQQYKLYHCWIVWVPSHQLRCSSHYTDSFVVWNALLISLSSTSYMYRATLD